MGKGLFITGTDTGVGKTLFACGLACSLRSLGYRVGVMKPVETGCAVRDGELFPPDASCLKEASASAAPLGRICPYRLPSPLAPSVAAEKAGVKIDPALLVRLYDEISGSSDLTLVEGAGGLLVPLLRHYTFADLARGLQLPLIVVVANRLGAINHALLTLEHASCIGLPVLGYVLNHMEDPPSPAAETNAVTLRSLTSVPCLGEIPYFSREPSDDSTPESRLSVLTTLFGGIIDFSLLKGFLPRKQTQA
jgi:dethiobiotin synthetase